MMFKKILLIGALFGIAASSLTVAYDISFFDSSRNLAAIGASEGTLFFNGFDSSSSTVGPRVTLVWNMGNVVSGYTVDRLKTGESQWQTLATVPVKHYYDTSAQPGVTYAYRVRFQRPTSAGYTNVTSQPVSVRIPTARGAVLAPSDLSTTYDPATRRVTLTWKDNSTNEAGFEIQQNLNGRGWMTVGGNFEYLESGIVPPPFATVKQNTTTYSLVLPSSGELYTAATFRVRAFNPALLAYGVTGFTNETDSVFNVLANSGDEYHLTLLFTAYMTDAMKTVAEDLGLQIIDLYPGDAISGQLAKVELRTYIPPVYPGGRALGSVQALAQNENPPAQNAAAEERKDCPISVDELGNGLWDNLKNFDKNNDGKVTPEEFIKNFVDKIKQELRNRIQRGEIPRVFEPMIDSMADRFMKKKKFAVFGIPPALAEHRLFDKGIDMYNALEDLANALYPNGATKDNARKVANDMDANNDGMISCDEKDKYQKDRGIQDKVKKFEDALEKVVQGAIDLGINVDEVLGSGSGSGDGSGGAPAGSGSGN